jgi:hypothetical protein
LTSQKKKKKKRRRSCGCCCRILHYQCLLFNGLGLWFYEVYTNPFPGCFAVYVLGFIFFPVMMTYVIPYSVFPEAFFITNCIYCIWFPEF